MKAPNVQRYLAEQRQKRLDKKFDITLDLIAIALFIMFILVIRYQIINGNI